MIRSRVNSSVRGLGERTRRSIRSRIGFESRAYQLAGRLADTYFALSRGRLGGWKLLSASRRSRSGLTAVKLPNLRYPIWIRPRSPDGDMIIGTVLRGEYGQLAEGFIPRTILDGGAYIGDVTAYFATRFPDARIIAVEAAMATFLIAETNLNPYGDHVILVNAALWSEETMVQFGGSETGASIGSAGDIVSATTVAALLQRQDWNELDLLKLDIEGAELAVLSSGVGSWLDRVKCIILEIHGPELTAQVVPLLEQNGFSCSQYRSVWYCDRDK